MVLSNFTSPRLIGGAAEPPPPALSRCHGDVDLPRIFGGQMSGEDHVSSTCSAASLSPLSPVSSSLTGTCAADAKSRWKITSFVSLAAAENSSERHTVQMNYAEDAAAHQPRRPIYILEPVSRSDCLQMRAGSLKSSDDLLIPSSLIKYSLKNIEKLQRPSHLSSTSDDLHCSERRRRPSILWERDRMLRGAGGERP